MVLWFFFFVIRIQNRMGLGILKRNYNVRLRDIETEILGEEGNRERERDREPTETPPQVFFRET